MAAFWALLNNVIELRTDAFKMCRIFQRPFAEPANSIGAWQVSISLLSSQHINFIVNHNAVNVKWQDTAGLQIIIFPCEEKFSTQAKFWSDKTKLYCRTLLKMNFFLRLIIWFALQKGACYKVMLSSITQDSCKIVNCQWWFENRT